MSDVFWVNYRATSMDILSKLERLIEESGVFEDIGSGDIVAVKVHPGLYGSVRYLRPVYVRKIVEVVKARGGKPFVTETVGHNPMGSRGTAEGYIREMIANGFTSETLGAPILIADGLWGLDEVKIEIDGLKLKETRIASAIAYSDFLVSIARVKAHGSAGFAAAIKNVGVGCVSRAGKSRIHFSSGPSINVKLCDGCSLCVKYCKLSAIKLRNGIPVIDPSRCNQCLICVNVCPKKALTADRTEPPETQYRIADSALAVSKALNGRIAYINVAVEITPQCDCGRRVDTPIVPDQGIFASRDPVALDRLVADKIVAAPGIPGSAAEDAGALDPGSDKILKIRGTDWRILLEAAEKIGLGSQRYHEVFLDI
ncbi:MAG: DUF362 domain-containing protein [Candidatus Bathyarchaeia archaeon]